MAESFLLDNPQEEGEDDDPQLFLLGLISSDMPGETFFVTQCGCVVTIEYVYDDLTKTLIEAYKLSGKDMPERIYKAWDNVIRTLKSLSATIYTLRFEIGGDEDNPQLEYLYEELIGGFITDVEVEGIGIDETDPVTIEINTETGLVLFGANRASYGQKVKITYKK
jgi:hypothetical protein